MAQGDDEYKVLQKTLAQSFDREFQSRQNATDVNRAVRCHVSMTDKVKEVGEVVKARMEAFSGACESYRKLIFEATGFIRDVVMTGNRQIVDKMVVRLVCCAYEAGAILSRVSKFLNDGLLHGEDDFCQYIKVDVDDQDEQLYDVKQRKLSLYCVRSCCEYAQALRTLYSKVHEFINNLKSSGKLTQIQLDGIVGQKNYPCTVNKKGGIENHAVRVWGKLHDDLNTVWVTYVEGNSGKRLRGFFDLLWTEVKTKFNVANHSDPKNIDSFKNDLVVTVGTASITCVVGSSFIRKEKRKTLCHSFYLATLVPTGIAQCVQFDDEDRAAVQEQQLLQEEEKQMQQKRQKEALMMKEQQQQQQGKNIRRSVERVTACEGTSVPLKKGLDETGGSEEGNLKDGKDNDAVVVESQSEEQDDGGADDSDESSRNQFEHRDGEMGNGEEYPSENNPDLTKIMDSFHNNQDLRQSTLQLSQELFRNTVKRAKLEEEARESVLNFLFKLKDTLVELEKDAQEQSIKLTLCQVFLNLCKYCCVYYSFLLFAVIPVYSRCSVYLSDFTFGGTQKKPAEIRRRWY